MNKLKNKSILLLAVLAMAIGSLSACHSDDKEKKEQQEEQEQQEAVETPTVQIVPVTKGRLSSNITIPGELIPYQQVDLYAKTNSYVKKLLVDIGSEVHQGQLLAVLEAPEINSQLAAAQSRIKQFEAVYFASKATYDRLVSTSKTPGTVSQNDLEQAEAKKNADEANIDAAKSGLKEVSANLAYLEIRAPFDGVITSRNVNLGAYVGPGGKSTDPLFTIQDQGRLRLVVSVPEIYTGALSNKSEVGFTVRALPSQKFTAQVKRIAGALDEKLRAERLEMDVYNKDKKLLPHMFAEVSVPLPAGDSTYVVPKTAVATSTEKVFVIKVVDHKAVWVDVKKGLSNGDSIEIFGGDLKPDDKLVKAASDEIRNGSTLKY
ncbi:efflux RND transporter periplasmic adaptor subunit [Mucilaginibacter rubeus]|uniref:Efflux RND transporter periplasmic adaptor subunit n=1 Tax=Mucilaginibacter rubeus TaxID=2027860 RepID=A0AAE6JG64_9SPHI|nr:MULTISPECIES: efflux RND transporter periplasmic adaptor subunit [Mucilaginibacter]QEM05157.1 efflux RND transporter periplasmic adaptor subunit [Mucilaginibacter rubeus]QEM17749.1 efflux RND transporter periplasmic adaptor subunit [Mucilaginibacter gossypii]QTE45724.1 efflux RND transporter periplasmic adaptor subunit [Mucilaginibacter rubeus]QTE52321.1 efflux RND transporter periplasmic adaptor subunit [Mucilaginibacter rubeus]QTE57410.1 efflux RND transporter periplasmic adaptor subunit 